MYIRVLSTVYALITLGGAAYVSSNSAPSIPPLAAIQRAENVSTGNPGLCPAGTKFFPQPIDHESFNGDWNDANETFLMQYEINDTYYKAGGPILFTRGPKTQ